MGGVQRQGPAGPLRPQQCPAHHLLALAFSSPSRCPSYSPGSRSPLPRDPLQDPKPTFTTLASLSYVGNTPPQQRFLRSNFLGVNLAPLLGFKASDDGGSPPPEISLLLATDHGITAPHKMRRACFISKQKKCLLSPGFLSALRTRHISPSTEGLGWGAGEMRTAKCSGKGTAGVLSQADDPFPGQCPLLLWAPGPAWSCCTRLCARAPLDLCPSALSPPLAGTPAKCEWPLSSNPPLTSILTHGRCPTKCPSLPVERPSTCQQLTLRAFSLRNLLKFPQQVSIFPSV